MAKLIITLDGSVVKEHTLNKERTTIGRKPGNDLQLDDATVSGQHAVILLLQNAYVEDLGSTNGTLLNGKPVTKRMLNHGDVVRIGQHEFKFVEEKAQDFESTVIISKPVLPEAAPAASGVAATGMAAPAPEPAAAALEARVKILNGPKSGEELPLLKSYTTVGKPGVQVAVIARRGQAYFLTPMSGVGDGSIPTKLNDEAVGARSHPLKEGDIIEVAGTRMEFKLG